MRAALAVQDRRCSAEYHEALKDDARQWDPANRNTDLPGEIPGAPTKGKPVWDLGGEWLQLSNCEGCKTTISRPVSVHLAVRL